MDSGLLEMNRRIFLDVGANTGQSLEAALDPAFKFDSIVCFEPVRACWKYLSEKATSKVRIERFGLWNRTCAEVIHEPGSKGASLWIKNGMRRPNIVELCIFHRASEWFKDNLREGDTVFLKLNCEGAECDILDDLLDSGEFSKATFTMVDFDVRKIDSQKHREAELRARLEPFAFPRVAFSKQVMVGATHELRIKHWLNLCLS